MAEIANKSEQARQLPLEGFEEVIKPMSIVVPLEQYEGQIPKGLMFKAYAWMLWEGLMQRVPRIIIDLENNTARPLSDKLTQGGSLNV